MIPASDTATVSNVVATGRRMNGAEMFITSGRAHLWVRMHLLPLFR